MRAARFLLLCLGLSACATSAPKLTLTRTEFTALPGWAEDDHAGALRVFQTSCAAIAKKPPEASIGQGLLAASASRWQELCETAATAPDARMFFESQFTPYRAGADGREEGLFTGYFEPLLDGSLTRDKRFRVPVYGKPPELGSDPYLTRAQINRGALRGRHLEIAWVDDPVALFFAEIQGSARLRLQSGEEIRIGYAGKNNQPYVAIGKILKEEEGLEEVNLFTIRNWLLRHPGRAREMMERNPSFVFFRRVEAEGAIGAQGVPLTPGRSLAVDWRYIPYGMPLFLITTQPLTAYAAEQPLARLMVAQDTGGAIRGPVRGDVFFGAGAEAEALAGMMKQQGGYALLVPNALGVP